MFPPVLSSLTCFRPSHFLESSWNDGFFICQVNVFAFAKDLVLVNVYLQAANMHHESSIIVIIIIIRKNPLCSWGEYMYKFYAVQRWSSYAYSAVNLKVGGVYLIVMLFTNCSFCRRFFVCDVKTLLCKYSKKKCLSCSWVSSLSLHWSHLYNNKSVWNLLRKRGLDGVPNSVE